MTFEIIDDYDLDDLYCPDCDTQLRSRNCTNIHCEDGYEDMYDDDPVNHPEPGEELHECDECKGTGIERWCSGCGKDWSGHEFNDESE